MQEIHDHPATPLFLRHFVTDALLQLQEFSDAYGPIAGRLRGRMDDARSVAVLDLCSGGGGPWYSLHRRLNEGRGGTASVTLTDKYPNLSAFQTMKDRTGSSIGYEARSVDATAVPAGVGGFRTLFNSFHHFNEQGARRILADAMERGEGVGVFEVPRRGWKTVVTIALTPVAVLWLTPRIRPFRWSRLFWTYVLPVIPFVVGFDGVVSCFRAYSLKELRQMVKEVSESPSKAGFHWEIGEERGGWLPVTYLIGWRSSAKQGAAST